MMKKTLYVSDLDGTLLSPAPAITEHTAAVINSLTAKGMHFTFATARSIYSAIPITSALNVNVPCLLMNGVSIYDIAAGGYIKSEFIPTEASAEVLAAFERHNIRCFMYRIDGEWLTCYYSELTTKVMRSFAEVRKHEYKKPFVQVPRLADYANADTVLRTEGLSVPVRSTVGAGDSVVAALAFALERGMPLHDAAVLSTAVGAANVMCSGTQAAERSAVDALLPKVICHTI